MNIEQTSNKYLNALYLKSKDDFDRGYSEKVIAKLIAIDRAQAHNVIKYLSEKGFVDTEIGFGDNIKLTTKGIDTVLKLRENKIFKTIKFKRVKYLPTSRDAIEFRYFYDIIDEEGTTEAKTIRVSISRSLSIGWGFQVWSMQPDTDYQNLVKMLLQSAKDKIIEKLKEGTLTNNEEMILLTSNAPNTPPCNPNNLIEPQNAEYEIEVGHNLLNEEIKENKLAAAIIETRDRINVIFHSKHGVSLLLLNEERNLLDFFKSATTEEEFSHRLASLGEVSRLMNADILREITGESDKAILSVSLLDKFLKKINKPNKTIIDNLKNIGRVRQGYPMHTDRAGVVQAYNFFGLQYPVEDFENTWTSLLNHYLKSLKQLYEILADVYLAKKQKH